MTKEYKEYLLSNEWKQKKKTLIKLYKGRCCNCEKTERLEVHHMTYMNIFCEPNNDLRVLCHSCHTMWHLNALTEYEYKKIKRFSLKNSGRSRPKSKMPNNIKKQINSEKQIKLRSNYRKKVKKINKRSRHKLH